MTNPTPSLTDEQVAAIRARLGVGCTAPSDVAVLLTDRDALARRVEELGAFHRSCASFEIRALLPTDQQLAWLAVTRASAPRPTTEETP